jgi:dimeric dUTPase (all-alpha-NTP-PPase superfamily)
MNELEVKLLETMMELQKGFNNKLRSDWRENPPAYADAIWTEAAEAFDHTQWPWWKKQGEAVDYDQIKMELIDIWHFLMSELMTYTANEDLDHIDLVKMVSEDIFGKKPADYVLDINMVREQFRNIVRTSLLPSSESRIVLILAAFVTAMVSLEMTWTEVYKLYVGKNTLNTFRQQNGYKTETDKYKNIWAREKGWEDNQYLTELLTTLDASKQVKDFQQDILSSLLEIFTRSSKILRKVA